MSERAQPGQVVNAVQALQQIDASGLRLRNGTPTNLDLVAIAPIRLAMDSRAQRFVFVELKFKKDGAEPCPDSETGIPLGQEMHLEALCDAISSKCACGPVQRRAIAIVAEHTFEAPAVIDAGEATVRWVYREGKWWPKPEPVTLAVRMKQFWINGK